MCLETKMQLDTQKLSQNIEVASFKCPYIQNSSLKLWSMVRIQKVNFENTEDLFSSQIVLRSPKKIKVKYALSMCLE